MFEIKLILAIQSKQKNSRKESLFCCLGRLLDTFRALDWVSVEKGLGCADYYKPPISPRLNKH